MSKILQNKELLQRTITAIFFVPLLLSIIIIGGLLYKAVFIAITLGALWELRNMIQKDRPWKIITIFSSFLLLLFCISMILVREKGLYPTLYCILLVWITDTMAYFCGKLIGGKKLAPRISPKKTISGFIGGIFFAGLFGILFHRLNFLIFYNDLIAFLMSVYLALFSSIGDLLESALKRYFGVKDSGKFLPGHGGILDRFDGMILASIANLPLIFL